METPSIFDTQGTNRDVIDIQYSRNQWRRDQYLLLNHPARGATDRIHSVLKESSETRSIFDTQQTETRLIFDTQQTETRLLSDTQEINGDAINIQFCLTEGKRLDDGQINL